MYQFNEQFTKSTAQFADVAANANPLGQSGTAAANLVLGGGTLKYTGFEKMGVERRL